MRVLFYRYWHSSICTLIVFVLSFVEGNQCGAVFRLGLGMLYPPSSDMTSSHSVS